MVPWLLMIFSSNAILDESRFTLRSFEKELPQGLVYTYDFGDDWEHVLMLEKVMPMTEGKPYPVLVDGARNCPPEDIGGIPGYQEFLGCLENPDDEELQEIYGTEMLKEYEPDYVGIEFVNDLLRKVYGKK